MAIPTRTIIKIVLFLAAVAALFTYWELNHPLSYTHYRRWITDCETAAAKDKAEGRPEARRCSISYDEWMTQMLPAAPTKDPSSSEKRGRN
jgi:hypothetical protein